MYALVPVIGVVLLVLYAEKDTLAAKLLSTKGFVGIGLISYSAYLWHQPLFAFARIRLLEHPSVLLMLTLSSLSMVLAYFSWRCIEKPFRDKSAISRTQIFSASLAVIASFSAVGLSGHLYHNQIEVIWLERQTPEVRSIYEVLSKANPSTSNWGSTSETRQEIAPCVFNVRELNREFETRIIECREQHGKGLLVLGDSHAIDLFGVIASREEHLFLVGVTQGSCRPHDNHSYCHYDRVLEFITENPDTFELVIYEQAGFYLLREDNGDKGSRKMFSSLGINEPVANIVVDEEHIHLTSQYLAQVSEVVDVNWFLPRAEPHIGKKIILRNGCAFEYSYRPNLYETFISLDNYIESLISSYSSDRLRTVRQNEMFQFNFPSDFINCSTVYWSDGDHLSASGEEYFGRRVTKELLLNE